MKKRISVAYGACVCCAVIFLVYMFCCAHVEQFSARNAEGYQVLKSHSYTVIEDEGAPIGHKEVYTVLPGEIPTGSNSFVFYTTHQDVEVYIGDELVYSIRKDTESSVGKSPGNRWNTVPLSLADQGKEIRAEIMPVYKSVSGLVPTFYAGSCFAVYMRIVEEDSPSILLSAIAVIMGLAFMVLNAFNYRNFDINNDLFLMGQFAVLIGIWKMTDTSLFGLVSGREEAVSYLPFLTLLLLVVPFTQYVRNLFTSSGHWSWNLSCLLSLGVFFVSMGAQALGVADLRELLWMNHLTMIFTVTVIFPMLYLEIRAHGWNRRLMVTAICMGSCLAGLCADILLYYMSGGASVTNMGMVGFLVYITVLGVMSLLDAKKLISIGLKAKHYKQLAYHDQLTGLYNRAAYSADIAKERFAPEGSIIIMFDLNDLKHCNDTYGHDKGDLYITSCAGLIRKVFGDAGRCYRVGGDEFCVLLKDRTAEECEGLVRQLKNEAGNWNARHQEKFKIQIAAGFALYDRELDYDIVDTGRRADKMMYMDKYMMKHGGMRGKEL